MSHELGCPVALTKEWTTPSELLTWQYYFARRKKEHDKEDWRAAMICQTFHRTMLGKSPDLSTFLVQFREPAKSLTAEEQAARSKAAWGAIVGVDLGTPK